MSELSRHNFGEEQQAVLDENTRTALKLGMVVRYHTALSRDAQLLERLASIPDDPAAPILAPKAEAKRRAVSAELPLAFSLEPSNMAVSVQAVKVDQDGEEVPFSSVQLGLVGGLAGEGQPSTPFTAEDLTFAVDRLKQQQQVGLAYGMPDSMYLP